MKKIIWGIAILFAWVSIVFAQASVEEYEPTTNDVVLLNTIMPMVHELSLQQRKWIELMIEKKLPTFTPWTRKHWFGESLITFMYTDILLKEVLINPPVPSNAVYVENWNTIWVYYKWTLEDGTLFDTNIETVAQEYGTYDARRPYEPLSFEVGAGQMIPWFDAGVVGMRLGETKTLVIPPEDAYGFGDHFLAGKTLVFEVTVEWVK